MEWEEIGWGESDCQSPDYSDGRMKDFGFGARIFERFFQEDNIQIST